MRALLPAAAVLGAVLLAVPARAALEEAFGQAVAAVTPEHAVVEWGRLAQAVTPECSITNMGRFRRELDDQGRGLSAKCAAPAGAAAARVTHLLSDPALAAALQAPDPDVDPMFAGRLARFGAVGTCVDRGAFRLSLNGLTVLVGAPCDSGEYSCWTCRDIPPALQKLVDELKKIETAELAKTPACRF